TGFDLDKPRPPQSVRGAFGILKEPWRREICQIRGVFGSTGKASYPLQQPGDVRAASTLRLQPPSRAERAIKVAEQPVMIAHPVKGRSTHDPVESMLKRQILQIGGYHRPAAAELRLQIFAGR